MIEEWKQIEEFENYEVSNYGQIRVKEYIKFQKHYSGKMSRYVHKSKVLKPRVSNSGYLTVCLWKNGRGKTVRIHQLVAKHFLPKVEGCNYINHLDANKENNHVSNLEWCTQSHNIQYAYDHGTKIPPHQRRVGQYDLNGNLVRIWDSLADAHRATGAYNIYKVCLGERNQAGGYIWKYMS